MILAAACVLLLVGSVGTVLVLLLRHEPAFYRRCHMSASDDRTRLSNDFETKFFSLVNGALNARQWGQVIAEEEINGFFQEEFVDKYNSMLPNQISDPRVALEQDKIRLAFRYGHGLRSTVISIDLKAWLVAAKPNVIVLEFLGIHAGLLPVAAPSLLEQVAEFAHQHDIDPTWYRLNGHPILLLQFQADRTKPTFQLNRLQLRPGKLELAGRCIPEAIAAPTPTAAAVPHEAAE
jgi:hypothetical protein